MRTLIVSDLHLGNGGPYDSFAGEQALPALIDEYAKSPTRILVNGDSLDFLMNEDPLELDPARAVAQARAIVAHRSSAAVLESMGRALAAGCELAFRLGNHDVECALPEVQAVVRSALGQPPEIAARLTFELGDAPKIIELGGARLLVSHGEQNDPWNRVDNYKGLVAASREFKFSPGSELVKKVLNRLTREHGLVFANLLKPDFQGGALAALAVAPAAVKMVLQGSTASILWQLFRKMSGPATFVPEEEGASAWGLADRVEGAGLSEEEQAALEEVLGDGPASFADDDTEGPLGRARIKMARAGLRLHAGVQRALAGTTGETFFSLDPSPEEWTEARRLADKYNVSAVILGHTHAARWGQRNDVLFANSGTWIWLMKLPPSDADDGAWMDFLSELRSNPRLDPARQKLARTMTRFTAVELDEHPSGGAQISLIEWVPGERPRTLGSTTVPRRA